MVRMLWVLGLVVIEFVAPACDSDAGFPHPTPPPILVSATPPDLTSRVSDEITIRLYNWGYSVSDSTACDIADSIEFVSEGNVASPVEAIIADPPIGADSGSKYLKLVSPDIGSGWTSVRLHLPDDVSADPRSLRKVDSDTPSAGDHTHELRLSTSSSPVVRALRLCERDSGAIEQAILEFSEAVRVDASVQGGVPTISLDSTFCSIEPLIPPELYDLGDGFDTDLLVFRCPPLTDQSILVLTLGDAVVATESGFPLKFWGSTNRTKQVPTSEMLPIEDNCLLWKD